MKTTQKMMLNTAKRAGKHFRKNLSILKIKGVSIILAVVFLHEANSELFLFVSKKPSFGFNNSWLPPKLLRKHLGSLYGHFLLLGFVMLSLKQDHSVPGCRPWLLQKLSLIIFVAGSLEMYVGIVRK